MSAVSVLGSADLERLLVVVQELATKRDLAHIMELVRTHARSIVGADGITFVLREGDEVYYADEDALAPLWKGRRFPAATCISGWCMLHRTPIALANVFADDRVPHEAYRQTFVKSLAMVPIRRDDPIGAIGAYWATEHEATERELTVLQSIADATAIAVDNERLRAKESYSRRRAEAIASQQQWLLETVSHDLRAPLSAVIMCSAMIVKDANGDPRNQKFRRHAEVIQRNADRMERLIRELLDVATIEGKGLKLDVRPVPAAGLLDELRELEPLAVEKRQQLHIPTDGIEQVEVLCDRDRIMQVLANLVGNAIKFTPQGGNIRAFARPVHNAVEFVVEDDGPGIDALLLPNLFDRFARGERRSNAHEGVGLGLAIAHGIVSAHAATLGVENKPGNGALFRFALPSPSSGPSSPDGPGE